MKATIHYVNPEPRLWEGQNGTVAFISGTFDDGSDWQVGAKPENATERIATFTALIGVEGEYELEAKPEYQGRPQWKMKSWPGKPSAGSGGGGKREYVVAFANTAEGLAYEQERMDRRTALMQGVVMSEAGNVLAALDTAEAFYDWLRATHSISAGSPISSGGAGDGSETAPSPSPASSSAKAAEGAAAPGGEEGLRGEASAPESPGAGHKLEGPDCEPWAASPTMKNFEVCAKGIHARKKAKT